MAAVCLGMGPPWPSSSWGEGGMRRGERRSGSDRDQTWMQAEVSREGAVQAEVSIGGVRCLAAVLRLDREGGGRRGEGVAHRQRGRRAAGGRAWGLELVQEHGREVGMGAGEGRQRHMGQGRFEPYREGSLWIIAGWRDSMQRNDRTAETKEVARQRDSLQRNDLTVETKEVTWIPPSSS
jgi:hypothetical protein